MSDPRGRSRAARKRVLQDVGTRGGPLGSEPGDQRRALGRAGLVTPGAHHKEKVAQVILPETGGDMSSFPRAHLAAWAGVATAVYEAAGNAALPVSSTATTG